MSTDTLNDTLPFTEAKQTAFLGHLIRDQEFFLQAMEYIHPQWFINEFDRRVYRVLVDFHSEFHRHPTTIEIKGSKAAITEDAIHRKAIELQVDLALHQADRVGQDVLKKEL